MFASDVYDIGTINPGDTVEVKWQLTCNPSDVLYFKPDCGCTASVKVEGNHLIARYTEQEAEKLTAEQVRDWYPTGKMSVLHGVWVWFKDQYPLWVEQKTLNPWVEGVSTGTKIIHPNKLKRKVTFMGYVRLRAPNPGGIHLGGPIKMIPRK